jgi:hypothetical protein
MERFHISKHFYKRIQDTKLVQYFLARKSRLDYDSLLTHAEYEKDYEADRNVSIDYDRMKWWPTIDHKLLFRQNTNARCRFLVSFSNKVEELHIQRLRERGFVVSCTSVMWSYSRRTMIIIAEENVQMDDAIDFARKISSVLMPPLVFQSITWTVKRGSELIEVSFATLDVLTSIIENGYEKTMIALDIDYVGTNDEELKKLFP